jgi:hypothetical protein
MTCKGQIAVKTKDEMRKRVFLHLTGPTLGVCVAYVHLPVLDVESHAGESIDGDLITKPW